LHRAGTICSVYSVVKLWFYELATEHAAEIHQFETNRVLRESPNKFQKSTNYYRI
jgi:Ni,Fe-hydrogenase III large subunit